MLLRPDISRKAKYIAWQYYATDTFRGKKDRAFILVGPDKCGKTIGLIEEFKQFGTIFYMSFKHNSDLQVLQTFRNLLAEKGIEADSTWKSCFTATNPITPSQKPIFIFDDIDYIADEQFYSLFKSYFHAKGRKHFLYIFVGSNYDYNQYPIHEDAHFRYVELMDFYVLRKNFITWSNVDLLRLHSLTDGYPALVACFNPEMSFEENLTRICDTQFISYTKSLMSGVFREPHVYDALLSAISTGHESIAAIGKATGYTYTKCNKYIDVLMDKGIVLPWIIKSDGKEKSAYRIRLGCLHFLYRYIYANPLIMLSGEMDTQSIAEEIDELFSRRKYMELCVNHFRSKAPSASGIPTYYQFITAKANNHNFEYRGFSVGNVAHIFVIHQDFENAFNYYDLEMLLKMLRKLPGRRHIHIYSVKRFSHAVEQYKNDCLDYIYLNIVHQIDKGVYDF